MKLRAILNPFSGQLSMVPKIDSKKIEIDFGLDPVYEKVFTVTDPSVTTCSVITGGMAYEAATEKSLDECEMDSLIFRFASGTGQFKIFANSLTGRVRGAFKLNYSVGG